jgi:hypothetical protein
VDRDELADVEGMATTLKWLVDAELTESTERVSSSEVGILGMDG